MSVRTPSEKVLISLKYYPLATKMRGHGRHGLDISEKAVNFEGNLKQNFSSENTQIERCKVMSVTGSLQNLTRNLTEAIKLSG